MKKIIILCIVSVALYSCGDNKSSFEKVEKDTSTEKATKASAEVLEESEAVCILDKLSLRKTPNKDGKWVTSISLGEIVTFTGLEQIDSVTKNTYYNIKLAGGDEGWARGDFIEVGGKVGVFVKDTEIYKRPDLLTKANKKYSQMDIIAVTKTQGDWIEVTGKRSEGKYIEKGWVKSGSISSDAINIATAKFGLSALNETDESKKIKALEEIINNSDLGTSDFIPVLQGMLTDMIPSDEEVLDTITEGTLGTDSIL